MKQLSLKFERTLEKTEQQLDAALSKLCLEYNEEVSMINIFNRYLNIHRIMYNQVLNLNQVN